MTVGTNWQTSALLFSYSLFILRLCNIECSFGKTNEFMPGPDEIGLALLGIGTGLLSSSSI
jgi:hypothetical protein